MKGLYPTLFPGGSSVTKIPFTQSQSACSKPVSASGPLCPHSCPLGFSGLLYTAIPHSHPTQPSSGPLCTVGPHTAVLWASVLGTATTPASALLSCSLAAVPLCHAQTTGQSSSYRVNSYVMPQVCSELVNQGQVRILATGTLILSTMPKTYS